MTVLERILERKRSQVATLRARGDARERAAEARRFPAPARGFRAALAGGPAPCVIAEIKRRSPSRGEIRADFDPAACAKTYEANGAAALSVLTDAEFFGGALEHLAAARRVCALPLLRKDFVIDPVQLHEARLAGADAVLLIVAALEDAALADLGAEARALGLDALVEVHDEAELERALATGAELVGVNNRDLRSFETDLAVTERLAPRVPSGVLVVAESGIHAPADLTRLARAGAHAFLVGESLMRAPDPGAALRRLREDP